VSDTRVSVLTPPGAAAIATVAVAGPRAWEAARQLFRPAGTKPLPEAPELHRFWFGTLGEGTGDEVILAVKQVGPEPHIEVHCHGGRWVVRWVVESFLASGGRELYSPGLAPGREAPGPGAGPGLYADLARAPTLRTASILLDQSHGAFDAVVRGIAAKLEAGESAVPELAELASFAPVGRHLVDPWRVVIAGPPNVGKSSLVNALAGYQRSVVSEVAGTTRDVVTVPVAFDGWPVELADTAGLRETAGLEAEGVERATRFLADADLIVWVLDAASGEPGDVSPPEVFGRDSGVLPGIRRAGQPGGGEPTPGSPGRLVVINKVDRPPAWDSSLTPDALRVSAVTGEGIPGLASAIARTLVPNPPPAGAAVPFTPRFADLVEAADQALKGNRPADAARLLRAAVPHA
jgi:tRNA modification GTPase